MVRYRSAIIRLHKYLSRTIIFSTMPLRKSSVQTKQIQGHLSIPSFAIEIAKFAVLRDYFLCVDLRVMGKDVLPPLLLIYFLEVHKYRLLVLCIAEIA